MSNAKLSKYHNSGNILNDKYKPIDIGIQIEEILKNFKPHLRWYRDKNLKWYIVHAHDKPQFMHSTDIILPNAQKIKVEGHKLQTQRKGVTHSNNHDRDNYTLLKDLINTIDGLYQSTYKDTKIKIIKSLKEELKQQKNRNEQLIRNCKSEQRKKWTKILAAKEQEIIQLKEQYFSAECKLEDKNKEFGTDDIDKLTKINKQLNEKINGKTPRGDDKTKKYIQRLKTDYDALKQEMNKLKKQNNTLDEKIKAKDFANAQLESANAQLERKINALKDDTDFAPDIFFEEEDEEKEMEKKDANNEVSKWLKNTVKMPEYTSNFLSDGFDRMESIYDLNDEDLKDMSIGKKGHRRTILKHVENLQPESKTIEDICDTFITNPVIVNVGISQYEIEIDLDECKKDITTMNRLWKIYGYSCVYDNLNQPNLKIDEFWAIMDKAKKQFINKSNNHDAIIISFSGHGGEESIWFSDYDGDHGAINIDFLQEFVSYPHVIDKTLRDLPRIAIIDACRGNKTVNSKMKGKKTVNAKMSVHPLDNWVALYSNASGYTSKNTLHGGCLIMSCFEVLSDICIKQPWTELTRQIKLKVSEKSNKLQCAEPVGVFPSKVYFKSLGKGSNRDNVYPFFEWNVSVVINDNVNEYMDGKINCKYKDKMMILKYNNDKDEIVFKQGDFKIKRNGNIVNLQLISNDVLIKIDCKSVKPARYWLKKFEKLNA